MNFDDIELDDLLEFLENGISKNMLPKMAAYMLMLEKIWGMYRRMFEFPNNEAIITHLVIADKLQRYQATRLLKDALSYFSSENNLPKSTWINLIVDKMLKAFTAAIRVAKTSRDFKDATSILVQIQQMLPEDAIEMDEDLMKQIQILSTDITMFGEQKEDRRAIAEYIDALPDVSENVKERAKLEVDQFPLRFLKSYDVSGSSTQDTES